MADLSIAFDQEKALKGMSEGDTAMLTELHDPGRRGTKEAQAAHAHATTSDEDPPVKCVMPHHAHQPRNGSA